VNQTSGTNPVADPAQAPEQAQPAGAASSPEPTGFRSRGSARRRARYLRKARELGYRDLGGLVFNLHRFGQRNDALVLAKLTTLGHIDTELRALEGVLHERQPVTVLREAGITACPRCAAIHSSEDGYCPNCGLPIGRNAELPIAAATPAASVDAQAAAAVAPPSVPTPASTPPTTPIPAPAGAPAPSSASGSDKPAGSDKPGVADSPAGSENPGESDSPAGSDKRDVSSVASPAAAAPATRVGRSPAPPSAFATGAPTPQPATSSQAIEEDGPTEILGPAVSDS
jgi:hypothetical protein